MYGNDTYTFFNTVSLAIGAAVAQPLALGGQINARKEKESQNFCGTITLSLITTKYIIAYSRPDMSRFYVTFRYIF